jgi:hypothetical protein
MAYSIETIDRENYVHIRFFGEWPKGEGNQILGDIFAAIVTSGHRKTLVDYRESGNMDSDTMMDYDEASYAAKLPDVNRYRFAVLFKPSEVSQFLFWETVAVNRGVNMKAFQDEEEAIKWLSK